MQEAKQRVPNNSLVSEEIKEENLCTIPVKNKNTGDKELHFEDSSGTNYRRGEFI